MVQDFVKTFISLYEICWFLWFGQDRNLHVKSLLVVQKVVRVESKAFEELVLTGQRSHSEREQRPYDPVVVHSQRALVAHIDAIGHDRVQGVDKLLHELAHEPDGAHEPHERVRCRVAHHRLLQVYLVLHDCLQCVILLRVD